MLGFNSHPLTFTPQIVCRTVLDLSCNREKYSEPEDVLWPDFLDWLILEFFVRDVPSTVPPKYPSAEAFAFRVEHDPQPENYAHTEVRTYKNGVFHRKNSEPNQTIKTWFRTELSLRTRLLPTKR
jgi:hypothetical protein